MEGSKKAVIIVPGGGFHISRPIFRGKDQTEGDMIAKALNRECIKRLCTG